MTVVIDSDGLPVRVRALGVYGAEVYWLFDYSGRLLYVGMGGEARTRLLEHRRTQPWWREVDPSRTTVQRYGSRHEAAAVEATSIREERPKYNILGTPQHGASRITPPAMAVLRSHRILGAAEIRELLGVSRQRVQQLISHPDFPEPHDTLAMGKVWLREDSFSTTGRAGTAAGRGGGAHSTPPAAVRVSTGRPRSSTATSSTRTTPAETARATACAVVRASSR